MDGQSRITRQIKKYLENQVITSISWDGALKIEFSCPSKSLLVCIENDYLFSAEGKECHLFQREGEAEKIRVLKNEACKAFFIKPDGSLELGFAPGNSKIIVNSHSDFEAWSIFSPEGLKVICMPGGELAIWNE
mgnify:CR=1 FL=1